MILVLLALMWFEYRQKAWLRHVCPVCLELKKGWRSGTTTPTRVSLRREVEMGSVVFESRQPKK